MSIEQKIGFDVSDALNALKTLDSSLSSLESRMQSVAQSFGGFNSSGSAADATAKKLGTTFRSDMVSGATAAQGSVVRLTTSMELLSRIVFTQNVIKGLRILETGFRDAAQAEIEFQTKIAEIRTLGTGESVNELGESLRKLAGDFNLDLIDVAKAKYQAASSGFVEAAQANDVLTASFKLSKVGVASAEQSLDLLAGALNAYGASSSQAEDFASKFFVAIQRGHLTADQLSSSLPKVISLAASLKVPVSEVLAQFVALSLSGNKAANSATYIGATLASLLKPSKDAKEALAALGKGTDIRDIIKAYGGVVPVVKALVDQAKGNPEVLGKIFPNRRALNEIVALSNNSFQRYRENLEAINNATPDNLNDRFVERMSGNAEKVSQALNKLKIARDEALGGAIIDAGASLLSFVGGVDNLSAAISASGPLLLGLGGTLSLLVARFTAAKLGATGFASALGAVAAVPLAFEAGSEIGKGLDKYLNPEKTDALKNLEAQHTSEIQALKKSGADRGSVILQQRANLRDEIGQSLGDINSRTSTRKFFDVGSVPNLLPGFNQLRSQFSTISQQARISDADIKSLFNDLNQFQKNVNGAGVVAKGVLGPDINSFSNALLKLKQLQDTGKEAATADLSAKATDQATSTAADTVKDSYDQARQSSAEILTNMQEAAQAAQQAASAAASTPEHQAFGGRIGKHYATGGMIDQYFAAGGQARGTDTVPAMLSPGEFVMNAQSTRKFYSQLVAMNSDKPVYRAEGGAVTNINGGVNLSIQASPNPQSTAREVMQMIRRETRRGSSLI